MSDTVYSGGLRPTPTLVRGGRYGLALLMVAGAVWVALITELLVRIPNLSLIFVLPVVVAAVNFGLGPALTAAAAGVISYNFFLIDPRYTLRVSDPANVWALVLLLLVAVIVSALAARVRRQAHDALDDARRGTALQGLARALAGAADRKAIASATAEALNSLFEAPALVMLMHSEQRDVSAAPTSIELQAADFEAAALAGASRRPTRADAYPTDGASFDFWPVISRGRQQAVVGLKLTTAAERPSNVEQLVETVTGYLGVSLDRAAYAEDAEEARLEAQGERLKTDLLAAVSHDLRTPLSTVLVTLQSLQRFSDIHDAATRAELLSLAETETARLARLVNDLLDMGRIEAGAVAVKVEPLAPALLATLALQRAEHALKGRIVLNEVPADLPPVLVDAALSESALANVLENAGKYTPPGSTVTVRCARDGTAAVLEVLDEGPGFPENTEPLFDRFTRGIQGDGRPPGAGLGLSIARGLLRAQGGDIDACNRTDGTGGRVRLLLPLAGTASDA